MRRLIDPPISPFQIQNSRLMATAVKSTVVPPWQSTAASVPVNPQASTLRRTTCDVCRERKVRCDRTKPECLRCRRSGTVCAYPSPDAEAAKIQQTLQSLSKRLGESCAPLLPPTFQLASHGSTQFADTSTEDAESKLQYRQLPPQGATPISASGGQMMDFSIVDLPGLGFAAEGGDDSFQAWYGCLRLVRVPMRALLIPAYLQGSAND